MGIERHTEEGILWQIDVMVRTKDLQNWVFPHVHAVYEGVRTFAEGSGGLLEWINLNYAHPTQKVLQSYGEANLGRMRQVAARYDPNGVFQRLCPGGFKLAAT
jgi:FAD/FMN-containing dehydrogenase